MSTSPFPQPSLARGFGLAGLICLALVCQAFASTGREVGDREQDAPPSAREEREAQEDRETGARYEVKISGVEDGALADLLQASSQLFALQDRPPPTLSRLRLRAENDLEHLAKALRSEGYYEGVATYSLDEEADPVTVTLEVTTGPRYRIATFEIVYEGTAEPPQSDRPDLSELGIEPKMPARAPDIVGAQSRWEKLMGERGYPLAEVKDRKAVIDKQADTMAVTLRADAGPIARFGAVSVKGLEEVEEDHVLRQATWEPGALYDSRKVEAFRVKLAASGLFSSVAVKPGDTLQKDGTIPIAVELAEAPHRSIGFGASYSTDIGFGGEVFWQHRNLFDRGEELQFSITGAQIEQSVEARFRKPEFLRPEQALLANVELNRKNTDAFDELGVVGYLGMDVPFAENWRLTGGVSPEYAYLEDQQDKQEFYLIGLPLAAQRDATDDLLNPTRGTRVDLSLTPYYGTGDETVTFVKSTVGGSAYYAMDAKGRFVLAGRARVGSLVGESTEDVPANKRFYAGGGGSVRGYEFQSVGPLKDNDPLGGRSLVEVSAEVRARVFEDFGVVPFIDGGTVYDSTYPSFDETVRWAAGLGFRYYTGIGPLRLDFAFPVNRRDRDDRFQFYLSFGQAF